MIQLHKLIEICTKYDLRFVKTTSIISKNAHPAMSIEMIFSNDSNFNGNKNVVLRIDYINEDVYSIDGEILSETNHYAFENARDSQVVQYIDEQYLPFLSTIQTQDLGAELEYAKQLNKPSENEIE